VTTSAPDHPVATHCANCGAAVSGNFCHECGQETVLHVASTREFMHEFIGHYVAVEGKLWKSLKLLLFRPGLLTLEYINGRRVRYIQPLRLYLTLSVIFFAVLQYGGHNLIHVGDGKPKSAAAAKDAKPVDADDHDDDDDAAKARAPATSDRPASTSASAAAAAAPANAPADELVHEDSPGEKHRLTRKLSTKVASVNQHWADKVTQFGDLPGDEQKQQVKEAFYHYTPYAVFFMMPLFALYLKVLYLGSGRRYGEHLLFALHANAFAYLAFTLMLLLPDGLHLWPLSLVLWVWLVFYLPTAMRRVYGGSRFVTALRWAVLMFLHLLTMSVAVLGALAFGVVH
jgi:hypothetical protein